MWPRQGCNLKGRTPNLFLLPPPSAPTLFRAALHVESINLHQLKYEQCFNPRVHPNPIRRGRAPLAAGRDRCSQDRAGPGLEAGRGEDVQVRALCREVVPKAAGGKHAT